MQSLHLEVKAGRPGAPGSSPLHSKFRASLEYRRPPKMKERERKKERKGGK